MAANGTSSLIEKFYSHFFGRDIAYIGAGALVLLVFKNAFPDATTGGFISWPVGEYTKTGLLIICSYFVGLGLSEFFNFCTPLFSKMIRPASLKEYADSPLETRSDTDLENRRHQSIVAQMLLLQGDIETHYHPRVLARHERTIYLMHVGACMGASALCCGILMLGSYFFVKRSISKIVLVGAFFAISYLSGRYCSYKREVGERELDMLFTGMPPTALTHTRTRRNWNMLRFVASEEGKFAMARELDLVPAGTRVESNGGGEKVDVSGSATRTFLCTMVITGQVEQESIDVSIYGSADGENWPGKPLLKLPQRFYRGETRAVLELALRPEVKFIRAHWELNRWGRVAPGRLFVFGLHLTEVPAMRLPAAVEKLAAG